MSTPAQFDHLSVVLVATRNPLNIGAAARAMSNFGFPRLRLVTPFEPAFREARSAVGASEVLARAEVFQSVAEAVADCTLVVGTTAVRHRDLHPPLRRLEVGARLVRKRLASNRVALLFGSEKRGLSNREIAGKLDISEGAVKASVRHVCEKLGVRTRSQLVKVALEQYKDQL